jgi:hypothetical protein
MQTLIDPFELDFLPAPVIERMTPTPEAAGDPLDVLQAQAERDSAPASIPRSPDSSGRLRCWCSED